jgi:hypothetical protein
MKRLVNLRARLWIALAFSLSAEALFAGTAGNPYLRVLDRNLFDLRAPQRQRPEPPPAPLARVKVVGITTMLGAKRALLKVFLPAQPPEPANELACILKIGQREGPIEVLDIDEVAGLVQVNNAGTEMMLALQKDTSRPPGPPPLPALPPRAALGVGLGVSAK